MPTLLVIDDEESILHAFRQNFREPAYTLLTASSAGEGLEQVRQRPDVVILDVHLPDSSGLETFEQIRRADARIPVILITGHGTTELAIEAIKRGAFDYLLKPPELPQLREIIARACASSRLMSVPAVVPVAAAVPVGRLLAAVAIMAVVGVERGTREMFQHPTEPQTHLRRGRRLARVAAVEDDVFHALAAQALGALFAHHPRDRVGDVALAAPVGADNRRHPLVEGELGAVGERLESVDLYSFEAHGLHHGRARRSGFMRKAEADTTR